MCSKNCIYKIYILKIYGFYIYIKFLLFFSIYITFYYYNCLLIYLSPPHCNFGSIRASTLSRLLLQFQHKAQPRAGIQIN